MTCSIRVYTIFFERFLIEKVKEAMKFVVYDGAAATIVLKGELGFK